jgi:hypothetical protein
MSKYHNNTSTNQRKALPMSDHLNTQARQAHRHDVMASGLTRTVSVMGDALAEAWVQGEHQLVRSTIILAGSEQQKDAWREATSARLADTPKLRDAFDNYMKGY